MQMIIQLLGYPTKEEVEIFSDIKDRELLNSLEGYSNLRSQFDSYFKDYKPEAVDLLKKMLVFDPNQRITVDDALNHPYLAELHCSDDEPITTHVSAFDFDFEIYELKNSDYRDLMWEEIMLYHDDEKIQEYLNNKETYPDGMLHLKYSGRTTEEQNCHQA